MTDKEFFLDKIKIQMPSAYEFAKKHYEFIKVEAAGHNIDKRQFCFRIKDSVILTKEMLAELTLIDSFEYVFLSRYETNIQFKKAIEQSGNT